MRKRRSRYGFTLIELIVVVVIIGILASIAIPNYVNTKEKSLDREAISALKLVRIANKQYYAKYEIFYPGAGLVTNIADINSNLSLDLGETNWDYSIQWLSATNFRVNASRTGGTRRWNISAGASEPTCSNACIN